MDRNEAAAAREKISIDILMKEFDRAVWEIHNRVEYRQRLMNLQFVFVGALTGAYATTIGKDLAELKHILWNTLPVIVVIFSAFLVEISTQDYYRFMAASYINTYLRPKISEITLDTHLMEWESHLRTEPKGNDSILRKVKGERLLTLIDQDTIFADLYFSNLVVMACFALMGFHLLGPWLRDGFWVWWNRAVMGDDWIWSDARILVWVSAGLFYVYSLRCWSKANRLRRSIASTDDAEDYCGVHHAYHPERSAGKAGGDGR